MTVEQLYWRRKCIWNISTMKRLVSTTTLRCTGICLCFVVPQLSGTFTDSVLLIVFSFGCCLPVTTVFPHAVRAQSCCDTDFLNSAGVTVPRTLVSSQKRTRFSFVNNLTWWSLIKACEGLHRSHLGRSVPIDDFMEIFHSHASSSGWCFLLIFAIWWSLLIPVPLQSGC